MNVPYVGHRSPIEPGRTIVRKNSTCSSPSQPSSRNGTPSSSTLRNETRITSGMVRIWLDRRISPMFPIDARMDGSAGNRAMLIFRFFFGKKISISSESGDSKMDGWRSIRRKRFDSSNPKYRQSKTPMAARGIGAQLQEASRTGKQLPGGVILPVPYPDIECSVDPGTGRDGRQWFMMINFL